MLEVLRAERLKLARHRATWLTVWVFPIGIVLAVVLMTLYEFARPEAPRPSPDAATWIRDAAQIWEGPASALGRYLIAAFTAVAFGGEYGWNTWKLIGPHRDRTTLLVAKYVVVLAILAASFVAYAGLFALATLINDALTNEPTPQGIEFGAFLAAQGPPALRTAVVTLLTVAYASTAAVLTRSTMAGAIIGIVLITLEAAARLLLAVSATAYHWSPTHHLANLSSWIQNGGPLRIPVTDPPIADSWQVSAIYLALLIGGLIALTIAAFRRQDLN